MSDCSVFLDVDLVGFLAVSDFFENFHFLSSFLSSIFSFTTAFTSWILSTFTLKVVNAVIVAIALFNGLFEPIIFERILEYQESSSTVPVSYTHLDVYKRQRIRRMPSGIASCGYRPCCCSPAVPLRCARH